ncbi:hypothetical protein [Kingella oralis]
MERRRLVAQPSSDVLNGIAPIATLSASRRRSILASPLRFATQAA